MFSFAHLLAPLALASPLTQPNELANSSASSLARSLSIAILRTAPSAVPSAVSSCLVTNHMLGAPETLPAALSAHLGTTVLADRNAAMGALISLLEEFDGDVWNQVHIEQRVIIRVAPLMLNRPVIAPIMEPLAEAVVPISPSMNVRVRERRAAKCMPAAGISSVQPVSDGRLLFHLRDHRMIAARLEKACNARDFYMGFYMSKTLDGQLCINRDQIHSRAGITCALKEVREFVPVEP